MSVLAKARGYSRGFPTFLFDAIPGFSYQEHGVDYIASLLQGYQDAPKDVKNTGRAILQYLYAGPSYRHDPATR